MSFIIPALNEANNIAKTLQRIHLFASKANLSYELILIDHGSSDGTAEIARNHGACVFFQIGGTIGELRNTGVARSCGNVIVFLDADVTLTQHWSDNIKRAILPLTQGHKVITGSHCSPPPSKNILLKHWFGSFARDPRNTHLGSGHMILSRSAFDAIGPFDSSLLTGEDYEFCERAKHAGYEIVNMHELEVVHPDFPATISEFIKREIWHARGDLKSFKTIANSKVALASILFIALHISLLVGAISGSIIAILLAIGFILASVFASSYVKHKHSGKKTIIFNTGIFYLYYIGRSAALIMRLFGIKSIRLH